MDTIIVPFIIILKFLRKVFLCFFINLPAHFRSKNLRFFVLCMHQLMLANRPLSRSSSQTKCIETLLIFSTKKRTFYLAGIIALLIILF